LAAIRRRLKRKRKKREKAGRKGRGSKARHEAHFVFDRRGKKREKGRGDITKKGRERRKIKAPLRARSLISDDLLAGRGKGKKKGREEKRGREGRGGGVAELMPQAGFFLMKICRKKKGEKREKKRKKRS